jgi:ADP-heptose:LPS heptosyltransferase
MASTPKLLEQMPKNNRPRFVRPNMIDQRTYDLLAANNVVSRKNKYRIGWMTGINRKEMQDFILSLLHQIDLKMTNVEFWYFGNADDFYKQTLKFKNIVIVRLAYVPTTNWKTFYKNMKMAALDVVINPLIENDIFFHCKSPLKYIEQGAIGTPLITSRVSPFTEVIKDGVNGLFASTPHEFVNKIIYLKENYDIALAISKKAQEDIRDNYIVDNYVPEFINNIIYSKMRAKKEFKKNPLNSNYVKDINSENFGYVTEELLNPLVHTFKVKKNGFCRVEYLGKVLNKTVNGAIKLVIKNKDSNTVVHERIYNTRNFDSDSWWAFEFEPAQYSMNCEFEVSIIPLEVVKGNSIKLYMHLIPNPSLGVFTINSIKKEGTLAFKTYCSSLVDKFPEERMPFIEPSIDVVTEKDNTQKKILIKIKGTLNEAIALIPIIKEFKKRNFDVFVATNHRSIFENNLYVKMTLPYDGLIAGMDYKLDFSQLPNQMGHIINSYSHLAFGHSDIDKDIDLFSSENDELLVQQILTSNKLEPKQFVVMHCGATAKNKTWPEDRWARLQSHILAQDLKVITIGQGSDFQPKIPSVINLVNRINFAQTKLIIDKAKAFITIDGDYLLLAGATDTPIIGLFFSTFSQYKWPYRKNILGSNCIEVIPKIECQGCWHQATNPSTYYGCKYSHFNCHNLITPKMILEKLGLL